MAAHDDALRVPPYSVEAEQAVLGGLMLAPESWDRVSDQLADGDFYRHDHRVIFRAIRELADRNQPFDAVTLGEVMDARGTGDEIGGLAYLIQLTANTPSAANIGAYAEIVAQKALLRRVIDGCTSVIERCYRGDASDPSALVDGAIGGLMGLQRSRSKAEWSVRDALKASWQRMSNAYHNPGVLPGVTTGLSELDARIGGLHPSDLVVIGARPAMGKTALLLGMAAAASMSGKPVAVISGEQPAIQMGDRLFSLAAGVAGDRIRMGRIDDDEWSRLTSAAERSVDLPMWIYDRPSPSVAEVARLLRRWKREHGIAAVYVDYLQRLEAPGERAFERVAQVAKGLKNIARELDVPVIALAQVKRDVEDRADKRPHMRDLCDSSEIEKEADQIVMLYRDDYYHADSNAPGTAELLVEKNRHGGTGFVRVGWQADRMRFSDLPDGWRPMADEPARRDVPAIGRGFRRGHGRSAGAGA